MVDLHRPAARLQEPGRTTWRYLQAATVAPLPWAVALGRISQQALAVICFSEFIRWFRLLSCHFRPDRRGHIQRITRWPWLLRSSQCCALLTRLAVRSARWRTGAR